MKQDIGKDNGVFYWGFDIYSNEPLKYWNMIVCNMYGNKFGYLYWFWSLFYSSEILSQWETWALNQIYFENLGEQI